MIGSEWQPVPWWKTVLLIGGPFLIFMGLLMALCSRPAPPAPSPSASPSAPAAIASSSSTATASQAVRVTIRRPSPGPHAPQIKSENLHNDPETQSGREVPTSQGYEEINIEVTQTATAAASSEASASSMATMQASMIPQHARLGVILATMPGILAADYQLLHLDASPLSRPVFSVDLELGLDVAGNAQVGALGVTAGGKAFAGVWAWSRWDLGEQGLAAGIGLRF